MVVENHQFLRVSSAVEVRDFNLIGVSLTKPGRALCLNPNDDLIVVQQGEILTWLGQPEEGIEWIHNAMRLNPYHPERFWGHLGRAHYMSRQYDEAVEAFKRITAPDHTHHSFLAASYAQMDDEAAAKTHTKVLSKQDPGGLSRDAPLQPRERPRP